MNQPRERPDSGIVVPRGLVHQAKSCAFCGGGILRPDSDFNMITMDRKAAMCSHCIECGAVAKNISMVYAYAKGEMGLPAIARRMERAVFGCPAGVKMKKAAVRVALGLVKRSTRILTGQELVNGCFAVRTADPDTFSECLAAAAGVVGIVVVQSPPEDSDKGFAHRKLLQMYNDDAYLAKHGVVVVTGRAQPTREHALVLVIGHPRAIDADGLDPAELA